MFRITSTCRLIKLKNQVIYQTTTKRRDGGERKMDWTYILFLVILAPAGSIEAYASRTYQPPLNQQAMQTVLSAIEERLRNLDKLYRRSATLEHHARRLELLETKIERFETILTSHLDKIEGNMSMQNFKDDIARDQVQRKIDAVYERMHNKLVHIEMKIDSGERNIKEKVELAIQRFEQLEETLSTRIEEEVNVVLAAVEKVRALNGEVLEVSKNHRENTLEAINATNAMCQKVGGAEKLQANVVKLESIVNATRYEQQNAMRSLVVQVGRLGGKNNVADSMSGGPNVAELTNISRQIDDKFDKLMEQQAIFLDSCHRIQSDEPQLESTITEILEKIIDTFQKESTIERKDIQNIEQLIKNHDSTMRRSLYTTSHNMGVLMQKSNEYKDDVRRDVAGVKQLVDELTAKFAEHQANGNLTKQNIILSLNTLKSDLGRIQLNGAQVQEVLTNIRSAIQEYAVNSTWQRAIDKDNVMIMRAEVQDVRKKLDFITDNAITLLRKTIEELLQKFAPNVTPPSTSTAENATFDLDDAIREVFGPVPNNQTLLVFNATRPITCINSSCIDCNCSATDNEVRANSTEGNDELEFDFDLRTLKDRIVSSNLTQMTSEAVDNTDEATTTPEISDETKPSSTQSNANETDPLGLLPVPTLARDVNEG